MIHLIALQIAADPSLDTVWRRWRLTDRQQKLCLAAVDQTISGKSDLREAIAALSNDLKLNQSSTDICCNPARVHSNTHSTGGIA